VLISWGGVLIVAGPGGIPATREQLETLFPFVFLAMLAGPSVAGIVLTGIVQALSEPRGERASYGFGLGVNTSTLMSLTGSAEY
jgi:hypothetical protein